jgi:uncharacterized protein (TIGR02147 family)
MDEINERQKELSKIHRGMDVSSYCDYRPWLEELYKQAKENIEQYSYILFSEDIGLGKSNASRLIIIGSRTLTVKAAEKILERLETKGPKKRYLLAMVAFVNNRDANKRDQFFSAMMQSKEKLTSNDDIDTKTLKYIERWYLPILREMTALESFRNDPKWIQSKLNFPVHLKEIRHAMKTLLELGLITYDETKNTYKRTEEKIHSPPELDQMAAVRFHQKMIDLGKDSILRVRQDQREVVAQTVALPLAAIEDLKAKIDQLLNEVEAMESHQNNSEIFQINIQLFPVTHIGDKDE